MNFDGSITPPLTDDENENLESLELDSSPILQKKMRLDILSTDGLAEAPNSRIGNDNTVIEHVELIGGLSGDNIHIICMEEKFRSETDVKGRFYRGLMQLQGLQNLENDSSMLKDESATQCLLKLFDDISLFCSSPHPEDLVYTIKKMLCMLCNELSSIDRYTQTPACRSYIKKYIRSSKPTFLHECDDANLIDYFHFYIKSHTCLIEVVHLLPNTHQISKLEILHFHGQPLSEYTEVGHQICSKVLLDLLSTSTNLFKQFVGEDNTSFMYWKTLLSKSPFPCQCFQDFLSTKIAKLVGEQQFWIILNTLLSNILLNAQSKSNDLTNITSTIQFEGLSSALSFSWWWMRDMPFECDAKYPLNLVSRLLRLSLRNCESEDEVLTFHLTCYRDVIRHMRKQSALPVWSSAELAPYHLLWHHYSPKFLLPKARISTGISIQQYFTKEMSVEDLLSKCRNLTNFDFNTSSHDDIDSFIVFLNVLSIVAQENGGEPWSKISDRLLSKIQLSTLKHMDEGALHRFFCLILVLLMSLSKVNAKNALEEWLTLIENSNLAGGKFAFSTQKVLSIGFFSIVSICNEKQFSFESIAKKMAKSFSVICRLLTSDAKASQREEIWKIFTLYVENLVSLLQTSTVHCLGQAELLEQGSIKMVLSSCQPHEEAYIASNVFEILTTLSEWTKGKAVNSSVVLLFDCIGKDIIAWLKKVCSSSEPPTDCCDIICHLSNLSNTINIKDSNSSISFMCLWKFFASEGQVNPAIRCAYLTNILNNELLTKESSHEFEEFAVQGWIRCCYSLNEENLQNLNREIVKLHVMREFSPEEGNDFNLNIFVTTLFQRFQQSRNFKDRVSVSTTACRLFMPTVESAVRAIKAPSADVKTVMCAYCCVGRIMQECTNLLFSSGKSSYVSKVMENFILLSNAIPLSSFINNALLHTLHKFILGLLTLGKKSIYLQKTLTEIFKLHLTRWSCFTTVGSSKYPHPFLKILLHPTLTQEDKDLFLKYLLVNCTSNSAVDKMTIIVELLHFWLAQQPMNDQSDPVESDTLPGFIPLLQQARIQLRFNQTLVDKTNNILHNIRNAS